MARRGEKKSHCPLTIIEPYSLIFAPSSSTTTNTTQSTKNLRFIICLQWKAVAHNYLILQNATLFWLSFSSALLVFCETTASTKSIAIICERVAAEEFQSNIVRVCVCASYWLANQHNFKPVHLLSPRDSIGNCDAIWACVASPSMLFDN